MHFNVQRLLWDLEHALSRLCFQYNLAARSITKLSRRHGFMCDTIQDAAIGQLLLPIAMGFWHFLLLGRLCLLYYRQSTNIRVLCTKQQ